ncbi:tRNA A37 methylthiotransferase MiaB [Bartonella fuyuanensis]|uniref:tRNA A37 methylthiotransferase MiaB n=1 Tax=Bartonella fuyuanensis TaxID=1460968 RepID=A0A840E5C9_9HYPH|nr:tRNA A37 methylthiotransferase MiaB [Bartonella fuyuanensis]
MNFTSTSKSDVIIVNTYGFLDSAKKESLVNIDESLKKWKSYCNRVSIADPDIICQAYPNVLAITGL